MATLAVKRTGGKRKRAEPLIFCTLVKAKHNFFLNLCYQCQCLCARSCLTLCDPVDCMQPTRHLCPWNFPGKNTGVGCHFLLQGNLCSKLQNQTSGNAFFLELVSAKPKVMRISTMHYEQFSALICNILKDFSRGISRAELTQSSIVNLLNIPKKFRNRSGKLHCEE